MAQEMMQSDIEKKQLQAARNSAVRHAWNKEKYLVLQGQGTVNWSPKQQSELIKTGHVEGFEGHHMKSVGDYPEFAGDEKNIQILSEEDHLSAHSQDYHNQTNGYYEPETQKMHEFNGDELIPVKSQTLEKPVYCEKIKTNQPADQKNENAFTSESQQNTQQIVAYEYGNNAFSQNETKNKPNQSNAMTESLDSSRTDISGSTSVPQTKENMTREL